MAKFEVTQTGLQSQVWSVFRVGIIELPTGQTPNDLTEEQINKLMDYANWELAQDDAVEQTEIEDTDWDDC